MAKAANKKGPSTRAWGIAAAGMIVVVLAFAVASFRDQPDSVDAKNLRYLREHAAAEASQGNLAKLRAVIKLFQHDHGRLPTGLQELKDRGYINQVPANVGYSPANGALFTRAQ